MKETKWINCGNDFNIKWFEMVCKKLEQGVKVRICTDCIGHSLNNSVQTTYRNALENKYGEKLQIIIHEGVCRYSYSYLLID